MTIKESLKMLDRVVHDEAGFVGTIVGTTPKKYLILLDGKKYPTWVNKSTKLLRRVGKR